MPCLAPPMLASLVLSYYRKLLSCRCPLSWRLLFPGAFSFTSSSSRPITTMSLLRLLSHAQPPICTSFVFLFQNQPTYLIQEDHQTSSQLDEDGVVYMHAQVGWWRSLIASFAATFQNAELIRCHYVVQQYMFLCESDFSRFTYELLDIPCHMPLVGM